MKSLIKTAIGLLFVMVSCEASFLRVTDHHGQTPLSPENNKAVEVEESSDVPGVIPGESPFEYCEESSDEDLFEIDWVAVTPTPPKIGDFFTFQASGTFKDDVSNHSIVHVDGSYNTRRSMDADFDFCEFTDEVSQDEGLVCPPHRGSALLTKEVFVMWGMPAGNYSAKVDAHTEDGRRIFCLYAKVYMTK